MRIAAVDGQIENNGQRFIDNAVAVDVGSETVGPVGDCRDHLAHVLFGSVPEFSNR